MKKQIMINDTIFYKIIKFGENETFKEILENLTYHKNFSDKNRERVFYDTFEYEVSEETYNKIKNINLENLIIL